MTRVALVKPENITDPIIQEIFNWVTQMESAVPNHFYVEMNFPEYFKAKLGSTKVLWQMGELTLPEIQHIGILVSKANGCPYCTAAFCTILNYGLNTEESYVAQLLTKGSAATTDQRLRTLLDFALKVNGDPKSVTDQDVQTLRNVGLSDKGVVQMVHLVSDFASYNRLNLALQTGYDYRDMWRGLAFDWKPEAGESAGDNTRGLRK
ncbi:MAG: carboxymuconolactone decarboxylase family protein [Betaproteobacteria bacterium]|nr:carboxymuconolactone decarboxylase family protein [Betaproteobacteria bacterium]